MRSAPGPSGGRVTAREGSLLVSSVGRSSVRCAGGGPGAREVWQSTCADQETECGRQCLSYTCCPLWGRGWPSNGSITTGQDRTGFSAVSCLEWEVLEIHAGDTRSVGGKNHTVYLLHRVYTQQAC